jgi:2-phosphosulfolactate phosphatase
MKTGATGPTIYTVLSANEKPPTTLGDTVACAVIDVLRATTTMVAALAAGAAVVYPVSDLDEALALRNYLRASGVAALLGGERDGFRVDGFDLGNSPLEYSERVIAGKAIVLSTSNGTAAIEAMSAAPNLLAAGFVNMKVTSEFIGSYCGNIVLCCGGKNGRASREDTVCAGGIINALLDKNPGMDDPSTVALDLYELYKNGLAEMIESTEHGRYLKSIGFEADLRIAGAVDAYPLVIGRREDGGFVIV